MAATPAIRALSQADVEHSVHRYRHDRRNDDYGAEAVAAMSAELGIAPEQVFKTLVIDVSGRLCVAVLPVPSMLSMKAAAAALGGSKATMADPAKVTRSTGYVLGGVSPLGQRTALPTVIDSSALQWPLVLCSAGQRGLEVALAPADLVAATSAITAAITA